MKKKMGRPKLAKGEAREKFISTRVSPPEYAEIAKAINDSPAQKTEWVRDRLVSRPHVQEDL